MIKKIEMCLVFLFLIAVSNSSYAGSTTHYCDRLCPEANGTYHKVRCFCKTVNGQEVQYGACSCGPDGAIPVDPSSIGFHINKKTNINPKSR